MSGSDSFNIALDQFQIKMIIDQFFSDIAFADSCLMMEAELYQDNCFTEILCFKTGN